jgi:transposase
LWGGGRTFADDFVWAGKIQKPVHVFRNSKHVKFLEFQKMSGGPQLTKENRRVKIVTLKEEGLSLKQIAEKTNSHRRTVQRICKTVRETNSFKDRPRSGRPPLLNERDKRVIARIIQKKEASNAESIRKVANLHYEIDVSRDTISRALTSFGYAARVKAKKPRLTINQKKSRLAWAKAHSTWTIDDWRKVLWSDETKFTLVNSEGKEYVWVREGESLNSNAVIGTTKFGGGKVMMWGCMTWEGVGFACRIDSTLDAELYTNILKEEMMDTIKFYKLKKEEIVFQHDNDPKHTSNLAKETLSKLKIEVMSWPAQSPDLNPIEHLWDHIKKNLKIDKRIFGTEDELWDQVQEEMKAENRDVCRKIIATMPERVIDVIRAKGGYTKW